MNAHTGDFRTLCGSGGVDDVPFCAFSLGEEEFFVIGLIILENFVGVADTANTSLKVQLGSQRGDLFPDGGHRPDDSSVNGQEPKASRPAIRIAQVLNGALRGKCLA